MTFLITFWVIFYILPAVANYAIAQKKNRNYWGWFLLGLMFSIFSTIILTVMTKKDKPVSY